MHGQYTVGSLKRVNQELNPITTVPWGQREGKCSLKFNIARKALAQNYSVTYIYWNSLFSKKNEVSPEATSAS